MAEKKLVIDQLRLNYEGLFDIPEMYKMIDGWFYEKGYDKYEKKNEEQVLPTGKEIIIDLRPWKKITDYAKNEIRIRIFMHHVKEIDIEKEGAKVTMHQGQIQMIFDGYLETDYENKWENKPIYFFLRTLFDKYIYKGYTSKFEDRLVNDVHDIHTRIKSFLNVYRYTSSTNMPKPGQAP